MPSFQNAGGSFTSAILLTLLAWGARWLRTELIKKKQQEEAAKQQSCAAVGRFFAPLSPAALRMLVGGRTERPARSAPPLPPSPTHA